MALATFTGRVTDFSRKPFTTAEALELRVKPAQSGYGGLGLLADKPIPVTVATDGAFSFALETTGSVLPVTFYVLEAKWLGDQGWTEWVRFRATSGGGNIKDIVDLVPPPGSVAYGFGPPTPELKAVFYLDISGHRPVLYAPEGSAI